MQKAHLIKEAALLMRRLRPVEVHSSICGRLLRLRQRQIKSLGGRQIN